MRRQISGNERSKTVTASSGLKNGRHDERVGDDRQPGENGRQCRVGEE